MSNLRSAKTKVADRPVREVTLRAPRTRVVPVVDAVVDPPKASSGRTTTRRVAAAAAAAAAAATGSTKSTTKKVASSAADASSDQHDDDGDASNTSTRRARRPAQSGVNKRTRSATGDDVKNVVAVPSTSRSATTRSSGKTQPAPKRTRRDGAANDVVPEATSAARSNVAKNDDSARAESSEVHRHNLLADVPRDKTQVGTWARC
jgi:hypothetical protein